MNAFPFLMISNPVNFVSPTFFVINTLLDYRFFHPLTVNVNAWLGDECKLIKCVNKT